MATRAYGLFVFPLLFISCFLTNIASAVNPSSTFVEPGQNGTNLTISVNVPKTNHANDDLFFHMSAPALQSWIAFGFGTGMSDSLIFVVYKAQDGKNITISPRLGKGHVMPEYYPNVTVTALAGSGITGGDADNGDYIVNAHCANCRQWSSGSIDTTSTKQPMIYAIGDAHGFFQTGDVNAIIKQHQAEGQFTMDLNAATGSGGVPTDTSKQTGTSHQGDANTGTTLGSAFHAVIMTATFVLIFPAGAIFLRIFEKVWLHWISQAFGALVVLVGMIVGIYISEKHDKHPKLNSFHQGFGLAISLLVFVQLGLGFLHHRMFRRTKTPSAPGKIHRFTGPALITGGIVNGAVGFNFADRRIHLLPYFLVVAGMALLSVGLFFMKKKRQQRSGGGNVPLHQYYGSNPQ